MSFKYFKGVCLAIIMASTTQAFGQAQTVSQPTDKTPLCYGIVVDSSGSLRSEFKYVIGTARYIVNANEQTDQTFAISFVDRDQIETVRDFTQDKASLIADLGQIYPRGGQTALIDALYLAAKHLSEVKTTCRKTLVVITDGDDRDSYYKADQLFSLLHENNVRVFVVGMVKQLKKDRGEKTYERAVNLLNKLASETGGQAYFPQNVADLERAANNVIDNIHK